MPVDLADQHSRWTIKLTGKVQGVGFRPYVYRLANQLQLVGNVSNDGLSVTINIETNESRLNDFLEQLHRQLPSQAKIDHLDIQENKPLGESGFNILPSQSQKKDLSEIPADLGICQNCIRELFDPEGRRHLYPFINCVECGPRFSCLTSLPYDRLNTSWNAFQTCENCEQEYLDGDSNNRRFHAQGNCCTECGPLYSLFDSDKNELSGDTIKTASELIKAGKIVAVKGMSGFHLVCDADNKEAISELRRRKHRPHKPLAMMALNTSSLSQWVKLDNASVEILESPATPIVLFPKIVPSYAQDLAPDIGDVGCILPHTPIYLLLFYYLNNRPSGTDWLCERLNIRLVVTSANKSGEAIHHDNEACLEDLKNIADYFLVHNRQVTFGCDDSVIQSGSPAVMIRRARGFAPLSIDFEQSSNLRDDSTESLSKTLMACGAHLKNTFCLCQEGKAIMSPHIGELSSPSQQKRFDALATGYQSFLDVSPSSISCDLHRDYASTVKAEQIADKSHIVLYRIQHHHAHFAAAMAEKGADPRESALGLILDGTGLGSDDTIWGGELFHYHNKQIERISHLEQITLPGGDKATKEIWRIGAALLYQHAPQNLEKYKTQLDSELVKHFIKDGKHIKTSSAGRWFDAVASIIGVRQACSYEAQAAMELEALASKAPLPSPLGLIEIEPHLRLSNLVTHLLQLPSSLETTAYQINAAALFHSELIDGLRRWLLHWSNKLHCKNIYISGGVFQSRIIREGLYQAMQQHGILLKIQKLTPINDGGVSLGQAWIAQHLAIDNNKEGKI